MTMIMNATMIMVVSMRPLVAKTASRRGLYGGHADRNGYVRPYRGSDGSLLGRVDRALAAEFPHRHGADAAAGHPGACPRQARRRRGELRLGDAGFSFADRCADPCAGGIRPNPARIAELVERSLMLVTALAPR